jgi:hypothetical protein
VRGAFATGNSQRRETSAIFLCLARFSQAREPVEFWARYRVAQDTAPGSSFLKIYFIKPQRMRLHSDMAIEGQTSVFMEYCISGSWNTLCFVLASFCISCRASGIHTKTDYSFF